MGCARHGSGKDSSKAPGDMDGTGYDPDRTSSKYKRRDGPSDGAPGPGGSGGTNANANAPGGSGGSGPGSQEPQTPNQYGIMKPFSSAFSRQEEPSGFLNTFNAFMH